MEEQDHDPKNDETQFDCPCGLSVYAPPQSVDEARLRITGMESSIEQFRVRAVERSESYDRGEMTAAQYETWTHQHNVALSYRTRRLELLLKWLEKFEERRSARESSEVRTLKQAIRELTAENESLQKINSKIKIDLNVMTGQVKKHTHLADDERKERELVYRTGARSLGGRSAPAFTPGVKRPRQEPTALRPGSERTAR